MAAKAEPSPQDEPFEGIYMTVLTDLCYTNCFPLAIFFEPAEYLRPEPGKVETQPDTQRMTGIRLSQTSHVSQIHPLTYSFACSPSPD